MWSRRSVLISFAGAAAAPEAWGESSGVLDWRGDIALLRDAYQALHPGLYRYNNPAEMRVRFDRLEHAFARVRTRREAYLALSRFLATIRCGHTYGNFYNQTEAVQTELFAPPPRLPFHFAWLNERMVVVANFSSDRRLAPGTEVLAVNGVSTRNILRRLMPFARADGSNDDKRRALLEVRGYDTFETFDVFYGLLFQPEPLFRLNARLPDGHAATFAVAGLDLAARRAAMSTGAQEDGPLWTLAYPHPQTAVLTMPNWVVYNTSWDWRGFLDRAFADMAARSVDKLIVDLRGNEGGNDCGDEIVARLIDGPIEREVNDRLVRYRSTPERLNPHLDTWDDSFRDWGNDAAPTRDGFYALSGEMEDGRIQPKGPRFRGELIVLVDAQNSSATFQFANCIQTNRLGRLIGQPTGGNQRGINGGAFFFLRLPSSGLEVDLPLIGFFPRSPKPDAGLTPDINVLPRPSDFATGRDPVLAAALA